MQEEEGVKKKEKKNGNVEDGGDKDKKEGIDSESNKERKRMVNRWKKEERTRDKGKKEILERR